MPVRAMRWVARLPEGSPEFPRFPMTLSSHLKTAWPRLSDSWTPDARSRHIAAYTENPPYGVDVAGLLAWTSSLVGQLDDRSSDVEAATAPQLRAT